MHESLHAVCRCMFGLILSNVFCPRPVPASPYRMTCACCMVAAFRATGALPDCPRGWMQGNGSPKSFNSRYSRFSLLIANAFRLNIVVGCGVGWGRESRAGLVCKTSCRSASPSIIFNSFWTVFLFSYSPLPNEYSSLLFADCSQVIILFASLYPVHVLEDKNEYLVLASCSNMPVREVLYLDLFLYLLMA